MDVENRETTSKKQQQQVESTKRRFKQATVDRVYHHSPGGSVESQKVEMNNKSQPL